MSILKSEELLYPVKGGGIYCPADNGYTEPSGLFEGVVPARGRDTNTRNLFFTNPETGKVVKLEGDDADGNMLYTVKVGDE